MLGRGQRLLSYDPDQIQVLFAAPHRWTPYYRLESSRRVIQTDARLWDYKHQVLATRHMAPWRVMLWSADRLGGTSVLPAPSSLFGELSYFGLQIGVLGFVTQQLLVTLTSSSPVTQHFVGHC